MEKKLDHGVLRDAILKVLKLHGGWMTAKQIIELVSDYGVHTTEGSLFVTLTKMRKVGHFKVDPYNKCKCCGRTIIAYKTLSAFLAAFILSFAAPSMAERYEMGSETDIQIIATVNQLLSVEESCNNADAPLECTITPGAEDTRTTQEMLHDWRMVDAPIQTQ